MRIVMRVEQKYAMLHYSAVKLFICKNDPDCNLPFCLITIKIISIDYENLICIHAAVNYLAICLIMGVVSATLRRKTPHKKQHKVG